MANREDIAYKSDLDGFLKGPSGATQQKIAVFGSDPGSIEQSSVSISDVVTVDEIASEVSDAVDEATSGILDSISNLLSSVNGVDALQAYASQAWTSGVSYSEGDFCRYDGDGYSGYKCKVTHVSGQSFDPTKWDGVLTEEGKSAIDDILLMYLAPEWSSSPSVEYKKGQLVKKDGVLQICTAAGHGVSATFSGSGANVDASISERVSGLDSELRDLIAQDISGGVPYRIKTVVDDGSEGPNKKTYRLFDRTVNIIASSVASGVTIELVPPEAPSVAASEDAIARDFYVVLLVDSNEDVSVSMKSMSVKDCNGGTVTLYVPKGEHATYRFTDEKEDHSEFLATLFADPSVQKVRQIEKALDDILEGEGIVVPSKNGILIYDLTDGKYHRMFAVTDEETGDVNVSVDNEGIDL